jgi:ribulose-bisphosphate carboxylase large chain
MDLDNAVICTYQLAGEFPLADAARVVAAEQTTGTWTKVKKRAGSREEELAGWVVDVDERRGLARVAFPFEIFEARNIPGFLSIVAGNFFGLGSLTKARWVDVEFPNAFIKEHKGPRLGIAGVRERVGTSKSKRPHGGTIVKPKVGLDPKGTAAVAKAAALGGLDLIKDDETLTDQAFCPLDERARLVLEALDEAKSQTGHTTLYAVNLTASPDEVLSRWDTVKAYGANCTMIDVLVAGYDALRIMRAEKGLNVPIHVHRALHGAFTRSPDYGISMLVLAKLVRLVGGDQLHVGSASGKMEHPEELPQLIDALRRPWHGLKPVFPVASGGMHPASVAAEAKVFGRDFIVQAGGGIHGHPDGTTAGAKALMQAIEAVHEGVDAAQYAKTHPELKKALEKWGHETYKYESFQER